MNSIIGYLLWIDIGGYYGSNINGRFNGGGTIIPLGYPDPDTETGVSSPWKAEYDCWIYWDVDRGDGWEAVEISTDGVNYHRVAYGAGGDDDHHGNSGFFPLRKNWYVRVINAGSIRAYKMATD